MCLSIYVYFYLYSLYDSKVLGSDLEVIKKEVIRGALDAVPCLILSRDAQQSLNRTWHRDFNEFIT